MPKPSDFEGELPEEIVFQRVQTGEFRFQKRESDIINIQALLQELRDRAIIDHRDTDRGLAETALIFLGTLKHEVTNR